MKWFLHVALILLLLGCATPNQHTETSYRGIYIYRAEVDVMQLCKSNATYWVWSQPAVHTLLDQEHRVFAGGAEQRLYLEFFGELLKAPEGNPGTGYDGLIRIDRVAAIAHAAPDDCR